MEIDNLFPFNILGSDKLEPLSSRFKVAYNGVLDVKFVEGSNAPNEPITLQEAKDWMKVDIGDDDAIITDLITASRELCEGFLNISLINRIVIAFINNNNGGQYLPYGPVIALTSIKDSKGCDIQPCDYRLQFEDFKRLLYPTDDSVRLEYTAGYATLPRRLRLGVLQQLLWFYEHRGDETHVGRGVEIVGISPEAEATLLPFKRTD